MNRLPMSRAKPGKVFSMLGSQSRREGLASDLTQHIPDIRVKADRLLFDVPGTEGIAKIDTDVGGLGIFRRHLPEGIFDDDRGVVAHPQLQK